MGRSSRIRRQVYRGSEIYGRTVIGAFIKSFVIAKFGREFDITEFCAVEPRYNKSVGTGKLIRYNGTPSDSLGFYCGVQEGPVN